MDFQQLAQKYTPFVQKNLLPITLGLFGLILLSYGLIGFLGSSQTKPDQNDILFESAEKSHFASLSAKEQASTLVVDIEGGVAKPGVYKLAKDARIQDAFIAAGGLSGEADRSWVAKNINLATKLTDGAKIYVPRIGEGITHSSLGSSGQASTTGQVNINTASEGELDALSGIGPATAQKIISNRPYNSIGELLEKKVVGQKVFENIKEKISIY